MLDRRPRGRQGPLAWLDGGTQAKESLNAPGARFGPQAKHAGLEARIVEESQRPLPDTATLARLKKEKLKVKEEMTGLTEPH